MLGAGRIGRRTEVRNVDRTLFCDVLAGGAYPNHLAFSKWRHSVSADTFVTSVRADLHNTSFNISTAAHTTLEDKCKYGKADVLFNANRMFSATSIKVHVSESNPVYRLAVYFSLDCQSTRFLTTFLKFNAISSFFRAICPVRCNVLHFTRMKFQVTCIQGYSKWLSGF